MWSSEAAERLARVAAAVRHDIGKHVTFALRFLGDSPTDAELRAALREDLGRTRSGPAGVLDLPAVWATLAPEVRSAVAPASEGLQAEVEAIDAAVAALASDLVTLDDAAGPALHAVAARAAHLADLTRALHRRALSESP
jgi:hypothetical protein